MISNSIGAPNLLVHFAPDWPPILDMMINCMKFWVILFSDKPKFTETCLFKTKIGGSFFSSRKYSLKPFWDSHKQKDTCRLSYLGNIGQFFFFRKSSEPIFKARLMSMLRCNNSRGGTPAVYMRPIMIAQYMLLHPMPTFVGTRWYKYRSSV